METTGAGVHVVAEEDQDDDCEVDDEHFVHLLAVRVAVAGCVAQS